MIYSGFIHFNNTDVDDVAVDAIKPAHLFGTRKFVDIHHNSELNTMNDVRLTLVDATHIDEPGVLNYYRSGLRSMCGSDLANVSFRNIPHWTAVDSNTVRVWASMSREKPKEMVFWYILETI